MHVDVHLCVNFAAESLRESVASLNVLLKSFLEFWVRLSFGILDLLESLCYLRLFVKSVPLFPNLEILRKLFSILTKRF